MRRRRENGREAGPWKPVSKYAYWAVIRAHKPDNSTRRQALKYNTYGQNVADLNRREEARRQWATPDG